MTKAAFIGLGVMGYPMAGHLAKSGFDMRVYNRTEQKSRKWIEEYGGEFAATPFEAAKGADVVFACVGNDDDVRAVTTGGQGAFSAMGKGAVFVDHTTASAQLARELDAAARLAGFGFIDAPVSGGQAGAENGVLTVMAGGESADFARAEPLINSYARMARLMGPAGSGQLTKMVNQISIAGLIEALAEAVHFAKTAGLDARSVIEVISKGAAQSWQMENRYETMIEGEYNHGFAVDWARKDFAICLDEARRNGAKLPVTALVDQLYGEVQAMGGGRWDTSSLLARLEK